MAADKSNDPGVLGNLPRSRPGQRSDKRGGTPAASPSTRAKVVKAKTTAKAKSSPAGTRKTATSSKKRAPVAKKPAAPVKETVTASTTEPRTPPPQRHDSGTDPVTGAVQLAGKVAATPLKVAAGILRRLPGR